jgi:hypothetical protein
MSFHFLYAVVAPVKRSIVVAKYQSGMSGVKGGVKFAVGITLLEQIRNASLKEANRRGSAYITREDQARNRVGANSNKVIT